MTKNFHHAVGATAAANLGPSAHDLAHCRLEAWLCAYLCRLTGMELAKVDINARFDRFGLDSYQGVVLTHELGEWLGVSIDPEEAFNHPSIAQLAAFLAEREDVQVAFADRE